MSPLCGCLLVMSMVALLTAQAAYTSPLDTLFLQQIDKTMKRVREVLEINKHPMLAGEVPHEYDDKYQITEFLGNMALESTSIALSGLGCTPQMLAPFVTQATNRTITLRFRAEERCEYLRMATRTVESPEHVVEKETKDFKKTTTKHKTLTTVIDHFWGVQIKYGVSICSGSDASSCLQVSVGRIATELRTPTNDTSPRVALHHPHPITLDISFFLQNIVYATVEDEMHLQTHFSIDRSHATCHTPVRNPTTETALRFLSDAKDWTSQIEKYFDMHIASLAAKKNELSLILDSHDPFLPVLPFMQPQHRNVNASASDLMMSRTDIAALLDEEEKSLRKSLSLLVEELPSEPLGQLNDSTLSPLISAQLAQLLITMRHFRKVGEYATKSILYVEDLLRQQLIAAIGREATPADVAKYMHRHNRKLFREEFAPQPLTRAIRRSQSHSPEGIVALEVLVEGDDAASPLFTIARPLHSVNISAESNEELTTRLADAVRMSLDSSTAITLTGKSFVHGALLHQFSMGSVPSLTLIASARQFSRYILLLGRIRAANVFEPSHAIIVKNKDELRIPINLEVIPSQREFESAISSLSPEQQEFASAIRALQMESTIFGVGVIQIKPQLEKVLNLPHDSLTKQIELTEQLMELFIEYQIPVDLLSANDMKTVSEAEAIREVKENVNIIQGMINRAKEKELHDKKMEDEFLDAGRHTKTDTYKYEMGYHTKSGGSFTIPTSAGLGRSGRILIRGDGTFEIYESSSIPTSVPAGIPEQSQNHKATSHTDGMETSVSTYSDSLDVLSLPGVLQQKFEESNNSNIIRPIILTAASQWTRYRQHDLFSERISMILSGEHHRTEKSKAFDLLDALTKSGGISIAASELHIVIASAHIFDKNLMDTVIQSNTNPVQKLEQSNIILASTILGKNISEIMFF